MGDLTRQQLCAALSISESTVCRLEKIGLPFTPVGSLSRRGVTESRVKRYDLAECKQWLRDNQCFTSMWLSRKLLI